MKWQGKIIKWNDERGFGFVEPNGGGERAFVHIKSFKTRSRRPVDGDLIIYETTRDKSNRCQAVNIKFTKLVMKSKKRKVYNNGPKFGLVIVLCFCLLVLASTIMRKIPIFVMALYVVLSLITFIAYAIDKSAAQNDRWRTKENTLHMFSIIGGWPGAYFAQNKLRHKSSKSQFKAVYWITALLNVVFFIWLHTNDGQDLLNNLIESFGLF